MKISIDELKPNPFRDLKKYSLNREKVDALKQSIEETGLWKNAFCVRKNIKDEYELVFGHHTLQAAKELGFKEVEIIVEDLSDEVMIKRMANENMEIWGPITSTILETVGAVKEYIDKELDKCDNLEECYSKFTIALFDGVKGDFKHCKNNGAGLNVILKFLGRPWKEWQVRDALKIINDKKIKLSAVEKMNKLSEATEAAVILNDYDVDEEDQEDIIDEIKEEIEDYKKDNKKINKKKRKEIAEDVIEKKGYEKEEKREYHKTKELNEKTIRKCYDSLAIVNGTLIEVLENWEYCDKRMKDKLLRQFNILFDMLNEYKDKINIEE